MKENVYLCICKFCKTNSLNKNNYEEKIHLPHLRVRTRR